MIAGMVREQRARLPQGTVRYLESGNGWPVVLLHAFPLGADMWRPQLERVGDGWRFIAPDLRGFGPAASGRARTLDDMAADVLALLDALHIGKAAIAGLSLGGYVAFALRRLAPERTSALILADTRAAADTEQGRAARTKMLETLRTEGVVAVADEMMPKLLAESTRRDRPEVERAARAIIAQNSSDGLAGAVEAIRDRPDSTPLLQTISIPTLLLVGEEDILTPPSEAEAMAAQISRSRAVTIPRAGHLSNLEAPETFSDALADFLMAPL